MKIKGNIWIAVLCAMQINAFAIMQDNNIYNDMSLEEMSQIDVVVSASKRAEDLFETPLSVTIIKKEQIVNAGSTSIPEALRLAPNVIVREITPGNYDVHLRGFDDITRSYILPQPVNTITLVMIDNRQSYSYYTGGTFWETLPVSINDIERIEIVIGPASALYGPNAVTGVINIITTHAKEEGMNTSFSVTRGSNNSGIINANIGYNNNDKMRISLSLNANSYDRTTNDYFSWDQKRYMPYDSMMFFMYGPHDLEDEGLSSLDDPKKSLRSVGMNLFFSYIFNDDIKLDAKAGTQGSQSQKVYVNNFETPLSYCESASTYSDIKLDLYGFKFQMFGEKGEYKTNYYYSTHEYENYSLSLDYDFDFSNFKFRPGIGANSSEYYSPVLQGVKLGLPEDSLGDKIFRKIRSLNSSFFFEWMPFSQLRFIAGIRDDYYEFNKKNAISYELAATYRIDKENLLRAVYSIAQRSPFMLDTYFSATSYGYAIMHPKDKDTIEVIPTYTYINGNQDLDLLTQRSIELGYRHKYSNIFSADFTVFYSKISNITLMTGKSHLFFNPVTQSPDSLVSYATFENTDALKASQFGVSLNLNYSPFDYLSLNLYGMYQQTDLDINNPEIDSTSLIRFENKSTPSYTLGAVINYSPFEKVNINANYYFMSEMTFSGLYGSEVREGNKLKTIYYDNKISGVHNLNLSINANVWDKFWLGLTCKNVIGSQLQYGFTDKIDRTFLLTMMIK